MCFGGRLPLPAIKLSDAKTFLGRVGYKVRRRRDGTLEKYDFVLHINTRIDLPEAELEDTLLHEMIHYYIGVNNLEDTSSHGQLFTGMMNEINRRFGRHITVTHRGNAQQNEQAVDRRPRLHVVAVITLTDGRTGVKVVPRIIERITMFRRQMMESGRVKSIEFYLTDNPFFNRYPNSTALRVYFLDRETITAQLAGVPPVSIPGL